MPRHWLLIVTVVLIVVGVIYIGRADYRAFDAQREDWHRRCDAYMNVEVGDPNEAKAKVCAAELNELIAYGRRKGWNR